MTSPKGSEPPGWVVWSTRASIDAGTPSLTAIVETLIAVPLYWWLAIHFETYLPLLVSACVAPLVLLRSDASVALGVKLFKAWEKRIIDPRAWSGLSARERSYVRAAVIAWATGAGVLSYMTAKFFIAGQGELPSFWLGIAVGFLAVELAVAAAVAGGVGGAVTGSRAGAGAEAAAAAAGVALMAAGALVAGGAAAAAAAGALAGALLAGGMVATLRAVTSWFARGREGELIALHGTWGLALGVFLVSVAVRIFATLRHPAVGLRALPDNFRRLMFCTSPLQTPELVPGLAETESEFTLAKVLARQKFWPVIILWFGPAWCYRFILKSTVWFWWPLAFLGGEARLAKTPTKFYRKTLGTLWAKTNIALAVLAILSFFVVNFILNGAVFKTNPLLIVFGYFLVVDWSPRSWQLFVAALAALSLAIVFLVEDANQDYREAAETNDRIELARVERKLVLIERLARLRVIFALAFWILVGGQTLLYFNSRACWTSVPANVQAWAEFTYGPRAPPACAV